MTDVSQPVLFPNRGQSPICKDQYIKILSSLSVSIDKVDVHSSSQRNINFDCVWVRLCPITGLVMQRCCLCLTATTNAEWRQTDRLTKSHRQTCCLHHCMFPTACTHIHVNVSKNRLGAPLYIKVVMYLENLTVMSRLRYMSWYFIFNATGRQKSRSNSNCLKLLPYQKWYFDFSSDSKWNTSSYHVFKPPYLFAVRVWYPVWRFDWSFGFTDCAAPIWTV